MVGEAGSDANEDADAGVVSAAAATADDGATSSKSRLNATAMRLCAAQMSSLQQQPLVVYSTTALEPPTVAGAPRFCYRVSLPHCDGAPCVTGAVAESIRASQHTAAERLLAFIDRVVESHTNRSYTFGFAQLHDLLHDLRTMRPAQEAQEAGFARSSFKELLHVLAMRLKQSHRHNPLNPTHDIAGAYLRYAPVPQGEGEEPLGHSPHGTPLERSSVTFVRFDGEPTFRGAPAAGRKAAEQAAAEVALAFIVDQTAQLVAASTPQTPHGHRGMAERGLLGLWGANVSVDPIFTRLKPGKEDTLQVALLRRRETGGWALPGCLALPGGERLPTGVSRIAVSEFKEEAMRTLEGSPELAADVCVRIDKLLTTGVLVREGRVDDPRNNPNGTAWVHSIVHHFHMGDPVLVANLPLKAGDGACALEWVDITPELALGPPLRHETSLFGLLRAAASGSVGEHEHTRLVHGVAEAFFARSRRR